jgi:expansin (peptidoglycan-binding protein)
LAAGGTAVLAGVIGIALAVQSGAGPACAAPPTGNTEHRGKATLYDLQNTGNCSTTAPADRMFVALGPSEYSAAAACGGYLDVTGPKGKVRVKVTDQCPECAPGHIDLSREAFTKIANPVQGIVPVTYRAAVNAAVPGPLTFRIKEGSSRHWFAVLVDNHANPLRSVEAKGPGGAWRATDRKDFNYWIADGGLGPGPFSIRVTDVYGRQATATGVTLSPGTVQRTGVRMSGSTGAVAPAPARPTRAAAPVPKKPSAARPTASRAVASPAASATAAAPADASAAQPAVPPVAQDGTPGAAAAQDGVAAPAGAGTRVALSGSSCS